MESATQLSDAGRAHATAAGAAKPVARIHATRHRVAVTADAACPTAAQNATATLATRAAPVAPHHLANARTIVKTCLVASEASATRALDSAPAVVAMEEVHPEGMIGTGTRTGYTPMEGTQSRVGPTMDTMEMRSKAACTNAVLCARGRQDHATQEAHRPETFGAVEGRIAPRTCIHADSRKAKVSTAIWIAEAG